MPGRIMTLEQVAEKLGMSASWVYNHTRTRVENPLPFRKFGKYLRFLEPEINEWIMEASLPKGKKASEQKSAAVKSGGSRLMFTNNSGRECRP